MRRCGGAADRRASLPAPAAAAAVAEAVIVTAKREKRVSKGATGLPLEIKDTPQTISTIDKQDLVDYDATGSNQALAQLGTGLLVEQYETNRAVFNSRGFEIQLTQIDGLGMSNDWGTVAGQQETYLFERIELIRGANGLLTGVGNASGTINYVRKRPLNADGGEVSLGIGSHHRLRGALDYNKVFTDDGAWAGRLVVAHEDKDSYLRALNDRRSSLYGVVEGQVGADGVLTAGYTLQDSRQKSPMWGSLVVNRADGTQVDFPRSSSTSVDWTYWNIQAQNAFVEYRHQLGRDWEAKATYSQRHVDEHVRLLYAYGVLNADNTGLAGWPYGSHVVTDNGVVDANLTGRFKAFGREHSLVAGLSHSQQKTRTDAYELQLAEMYLPLPAFPYGGNAYPEPAWNADAMYRASEGEQKLTRLYAASRLTLTDGLKAIVGVNAIRLQREGSSRYGNAVRPVPYPDTKEVSPYVGLTYDFTDRILGYVSYSDIFQNQDQTDINRDYLDPMKGVNAEIGVKAEWLDRKLLTTVAVFSARQKGLATYAGKLVDNPDTIEDEGQTDYYEPRDVDSKGFEIEASGRIDADARLSLGFTRLKLTGPDGNNIYEWVPRTMVNLRYDTRVPMLPPLRLGVGLRWQSDVYKIGGARQDAYLLANAFASYDLGERASLRLNVSNLTDKKYLGTVIYGAIYGAPREYALTLSYKL